MMFIKDYYELLKNADLLKSASEGVKASEIEIKAVSYNSAKVEKDSLFICKGKRFKREYVEDAVRGGAILTVSEERYEGIDAMYILVSDIRRAMALIAEYHHDHPQNKLFKVGITGTKGKTTTAYFYKRIMDEYSASEGRKPTAIFSSICNYYGKNTEKSSLTTPESPDLYEYMACAVNEGIEDLVMEASSQGLKYNRLDGVEFEVGIFLNIGEDHISPFEHSDFEDYFGAKKRIADISKTLLVNGDIPEYREVSKRHTGRTLIFSTENESADYYGYYMRSEGHGTSFFVKSKDFNRKFYIPMKGDFNVSNAIAAIAAADIRGVPVHVIERGLSKAQVEGRMEFVGSEDGNINVIVDYAHNKLSFRALFEYVKKEFPGKGIVAVFGCPGEKAYDRRRELPAISAEYCRHIFLSNDDSGYEPFEKITEEVIVNFPEGTGYTVMKDREKAIVTALDLYGKDCVIVLAGKGRETTQRAPGGYEPYISDYVCAEEYVKQYNEENKK